MGTTSVVLQSKVYTNNLLILLIIKINIVTGKSGLMFNSELGFNQPFIPSLERMGANRRTEGWLMTDSRFKFFGSEDNYGI